VFAKASETVSEDVGTINITVNRTNGSDGNVTVDYAVFRHTASPGSDFVLGGSGKLQFAHGETSQSFTLTLIDDMLYEGEESVTLYLKDSTGGSTIGNPGQMTITILDNEIANPGVIQFSTTQYSVSESGLFVDLLLERTNGADGNVTVSYSVAGGTATPNVDFTGASGTVTFTQNELQDTIRITINNDNIQELNETIVIILRDPTGGATLGSATTATITIIDDDVSGSGTPNPPPPGGGNTGGNPPPSSDPKSSSKKAGGGSINAINVMLLFWLFSLIRFGGKRAQYISS
jgi:hypothetical protein